MTLFIVILLYILMGIISATILALINKKAHIVDSQEIGMAILIWPMLIVIGIPFGICFIIEKLGRLIEKAVNKYV